ncbi:hypothetical protein F0P93_11315 [Larkinella humicola]|uniref:Yip1 domain-containing protein n=1 Tax=Larkinella humicola TaxID=2607654 RepID=A0A5N1JI98_9BACT|nr:hypothetical protein F0P93_11315 [Larkinella humicola]
MVLRQVNVFRFLFLCALALIIQWAFQYFLISDQLYFNSLSNQLTYERIQELIDQSKEWQWLGYVLVPVLYLVKFGLVAGCLGIGYFFATSQFAFKRFFGVAIQAELVFLIPILFKLLWFLFVQTDFDLTAIGQFYPLSALTLFNASELPPYYLYPLQVLNLFEVAYWFLLAYGVTQTLEMPFSKAFSLVLSSYGIGLLLWITGVVFITVTYTS